MLHRRIFPARVLHSWVFHQRPYSARIVRTASYFSSSTTAELGGILLALQNSPKNQPLTIHTNSQACIGKIVNYQTLTSTRNKLREPDHDMLYCIASLIEMRTTPPRLQWIKGHSGNAMNEVADLLANQARSTETQPLPIAETTSIQFQLGCTNGILNEYPRTTLKKQAALATLQLLPIQLKFLKPAQRSPITEYNTTMFPNLSNPWAPSFN